MNRSIMMLEKSENVLSTLRVDAVFFSVFLR